MLLAQIEPVSHVQLGTATAIFIAMAVAGSNIALAIAAFRKRDTSISPQPFMVQLEEKFVDREAFNQLVSTVERNRVAGEESRKNLYVKIDDVRKELAGKIDMQSAEFGEALRQVPHQTVALLRNTGVIK
jgi:neutral trehalase